MKGSIVEVMEMMSPSKIVSNTSCTSSCTDLDTSNKRKRPKKIDKVDKITSIIDKMVQLQEASDKMFCSIEEKRLKKQ